MLSALAFLTLGGCGSTAPVDLAPPKIVIPDPPAAAMAYCADPQDVPEPGTMNGAQKEALVTTDRLNFADCGRRHYVLVKWAEGQIAAFAQSGAGT